MSGKAACWEATLAHPLQPPSPSATPLLYVPKPLPTNKPNQTHNKPTRAVATPGNGWLRPGNADGNVVPCPVGTFNLARFTKAPAAAVAAGATPAGCRPCAGGFTTVAGAADSSDLCVAPPGFTVDAAGKLAPCRQGTYKETTSNDACVYCPDGWSTVGTGSNSSGQCTRE